MDGKKQPPKSDRYLAGQTIRMGPPEEEGELREYDEPEPMNTRHTFGSTLRMDSAPLRPVQDPPAKTRSADGIELLVVEEKQVPGAEHRPWRAAEVWTRRRIYGLDSTFKCVEILDRSTGRPEAGNEMLGARLGGGRLRERDAVRFSYPLPLPGMEAMFSKGRKHGYTSPIERMVVRIRVLHTSPDEAMPTWEDIASRWSDLPPKP